MYWYNPATRTSERVEAPSTDEQAIEMLAGDVASATFDRSRHWIDLFEEQGMEIEGALIMVGHELRLRHMELAAPNAFAPSAVGYDLLVGAGPSSRR